jgi:hypothetical protein
MVLVVSFVLDPCIFLGVHGLSHILACSRIGSLLLVQGGKGFPLLIWSGALGSHEHAPLAGFVPMFSGDNNSSSLQLLHQWPHQKTSFPRG